MTDLYKKTNYGQVITASEERFKALVVATSDMIYTMSPDWSEMHQLDGRGFLIDTHEPTTDWLPKYIHPEDQEIVKTAIREAIREQKIFQLEHRVLRTDGTTGWTSSRAVPILDDKGCIVEWFGAASDISERKFAAKNVERAEESLRMAIDAAGLGTFQINATDRTFLASPKLKEFFGFRPDEDIPYEAAITQIHPDYRQQVADMVEAVFTTGVKFETEYPIISHQDGTIRWVRAIGKRLHGDGKDYFTGVLHEITEIKRDELRKNDFIGMVSHEMKTPLTSVNAYLQMLQAKAKKAGDDFTLNTLDQSVKQIKRMTTMINGFLNISRLESGKINIDKKIFDMAVLVKESEAETLPMYTSHQIIFKPVEETFVNADREKILQVINNLISNAVKYSRAGTKIQVACVTVEGFAQVSVKDEGLGIRAKDLSRIFERYYRVENNTNISGFGIGLYLTAEIIDRHEGKIWGESEFGKGSTFYFRLPVAVG